MVFPANALKCYQCGEESNFYTCKNINDTGVLTDCSDKQSEYCTFTKEEDKKGK